MARLFQPRRANNLFKSKARYQDKNDDQMVVSYYVIAYQNVYAVSVN